jgi:hypothetical protein
VSLRGHRDNSRTGINTTVRRRDDLRRRVDNRIPVRESASESCHKQLPGSLITGSAQVAAADTKSRHLCVLIDIWNHMVSFAISAMAYDKGQG